MTLLEEVVIPAIDRTDADDEDHFVCCDLDLPEGTRVVALCGKMTTFSGALVDEVGCADCMKADAEDRCPYKADGRCDA